MDRDLEYEQDHTVIFEGLRSLESGVVYGDPVDSIYLRFGYPDKIEDLTIIMTESEALAVVHMLSGTLLTSLEIPAAFAEQVDEEIGNNNRVIGNGNGPQESGSSHSEGSTCTDD
ncbi:MAG: hypothetical protein GQ524_01970 [Anaerolineales bacterium]|nr:hypothetical protein [Anaerolineales bacterium]